ncbi:DNA gyrase/topoisomerase IV subunit A [Arsenicicoccus sp. oral taxon 190]|uniref:DNA gyrase/topoisomerase IV subunit A n=1 Tax=Arsenicicoccus sp. oral taxon 190 TaxID=1658671 RepID=UPI000679FDA7|nr:DNA topoisomerase IV subunit A [Arsenicicoccus sp. oral taxon 190]AKT52028.1 DNA topoisomerase IV subunit A [Arsenicicoccus sp. oral taxon 190]
MARRTTPPTLDEDFVENIIDIDVSDEMQQAFLEYSYSVIFSRALPDARDGLKPVQRRILYGMHELGLRPERGHVKSSRIVGEVMGKYHPHGDGAIYDALVRMAQPFTMRLPLVDGHGNFGSLDDGPAASRYTEARMAPAALAMLASLDEDTVDFVPNYDDQLTQPGVLPAAFPNLLVNGASGIAVGMATNMPPHNLVEVIGAARHLIAHPDCSLDDLMKFVPGPDLPCGGRIVGLEGIRDAYLTGRGSFKTRATARIENVTPRKKGIVVTELPYLVGPEKVRDKIKDLVQSKKLQGISDFKDLTDRKHGLRLVIEVKNGFNPDAVLEQLYKLTPMEDSFGINNVALVNGQPQTLGLKDLLRVYVDFRTDVVRRRSQYRLGKKEERLHLVEGLLVAILDIDEVIQIVRSSDDAGIARERLMQVFDLSEAQATYILDLQLRRLTKFSQIELEKERDELQREIAELRELLADESLLLRLVSTELADMAKAHGTPRRTVLLESSGVAASTAASPLEVADDPCHVLLSSTGLLARTSDGSPLSNEGGRAKHDAVVGVVPTTARGDFGLVTSAGRVVRLSALDLPSLPPTNGAPSLSGGAPVAAYVELAAGEVPLTIMSLSADSRGLALGTAQGVVKRVTTDYPGNRGDWEMIALKPGDRVVGAVELRTGDEELCFVTTDAQLLHFPASVVRPQGRSAGGMAGIRLSAKASALWFGAVDPAADVVVVTGAGSAGALPGTEVPSLKVTPFAEYPGKGRGTGGVRCQRFLHGQDQLVLAWVGAQPARAAQANGVAVPLPEATGKRDGSGLPAKAPIAAVGGALPETASVTVGAAAAAPTQADAAGTGDGLFDLPPNTGPTRERIVVDHDDYDPDSLDDVVQTSRD